MQILMLKHVNLIVVSYLIIGCLKIKLTFLYSPFFLCSANFAGVCILV